MKTRLLSFLWICMIGGSALLLVCLSARPSYALRANMMKDLKRLEDMGQYEMALFYRRATRDMVMALHVAWAGAPYDPQMDGVYGQLDRIYAAGRRTRPQPVETRVDRRYWGIINSQKRPISELLAKAKLTDAQLDRLNDRVRVYVEDHLCPEFGEMGNFFFRAKAQIFERTGLFWDASFRRRLTGYYDMRVCVPYYATAAEELESRGRKRKAEAYRRRSEWYREQALREFRRSNGDRLLAELQKGNRRQRLDRDKVIEILKAGFQSKDSDARFAALLNLVELGETAALLPAATDPDPSIRLEAAQAAAAHLYLPALALLVEDENAGVKQIASAALNPPSSDRGPFIRTMCALHDALSEDEQAGYAGYAGSQVSRIAKLKTAPVGEALQAWAKKACDGLRPGIHAQYLDRPGRAPVAEKVLRAVDLGFRGNERFPNVLRGYWAKEQLLPANAAGQFMLRFTGQIYIPDDGQYRFYVRTESGNRATMHLGVPGGPLQTVISPKNDKQLLYADQRGWKGDVLHRIDFCTPLDLKKGLMEVEILYKGANVRTKYGTAGLKLYWSSDQHVMELVPAAALFHKPE